MLSKALKRHGSIVSSDPHPDQKSEFAQLERLTNGNGLSRNGKVCHSKVTFARFILSLEDFHLSVVGKIPTREIRSVLCETLRRSKRVTNLISPTYILAEISVDEKIRCLHPRPCAVGKKTIE